MKTFFVNSILVVGTLILTSTSFGQRVNTPDYWRCVNRVGGEWNFGRVPSGCDLNTLADPDRVANNYGPIVFDDQKNRGLERDRYMKSLQTVIRDAATYYIRERKPNISNSELAAWQTAMYTLSNSESFWSHYRSSSSGKMKITRGDFGHGHGLMQIDDRWHFNAVKDGNAWDIMFNFKYGMDIFYREWERAKSARCVSSPTNWIERTRSAWAAFNGGPTRLCRWTNPNDRWARNDRNFYAKLRSKAWDPYIDDYNLKSPINVKCLMEDTNADCPDQGDSNQDPTYQLIRYNNGHQCLFIGSRMHCTYDSKNFTCLARYFDKNPSGIYDADDDEFSDTTKTFWVTNFLCEETIKNLVSYGSHIETQKRINLRETPAGRLLTVLPIRTVLTVLDYHIDQFETGKRWYRVNFEGQTGYIYSGDESDALEWSTPTNAAPRELPYASTSERIHINNEYGINLRQVVKGRLLINVPKGSIVEVLSTSFEQDSTRVYYQINYQGQLGWIYGGQGQPENTYSNWASVVESQKRFASLNSSLWYRYLKECPDDNCNLTSSYIRSARLSNHADRVEVLEVNGQWQKVKVERNKSVGWIKASELELIEGEL